MNLIFAFVFYLCIHLSSCRSVKYDEDDSIKDIFDKQSSPSEMDNQNSLLNKLRFLKLLPLNKEWKNTIDKHGHPLKPETKNKNSVPIAIIIATPDKFINKVKSSELKTTTVKDEESIPIKGESNEISNTGEDNDENNDESKIYDDNKLGLSFNNIEEKIGEVLFRTEAETNTDINDTLKNDELISTKPQTKDETNIETQIENITIQNNDADTRRVETDISKEDIGNEEALQHKHSTLEVKDDPKDTTDFKPLHYKQSNHEFDINVNDDNLKTFHVSYVLNKYVYLK